LAVIAPRYHRSIIGGSELYLRELLEGLAARGVDVEELTTGSMQVRFTGEHAIRWHDEQPGADNSSVAVRRFPVVSCHAPLERTLTRFLERSLAEVTTRHALPASGFLGSGFYAVEGSGEGRFRWTAPAASIILGETRALRLRIDVQVQQTTELRLQPTNGRPVTVEIDPGGWQAVEVTLPAAGARAVHLATTPPFRPDGDARTLGVAVSSIQIDTGDRVEPIALDTDEESVARTLPTDVLAACLDARCQALPRRAGLADALLKGPTSPSLAWAALRAARRSDAVLATNAPYSTLALGWLAARTARRPYLALPFFHLRDGFHHRPQVRGPLRAADRVLCLGDAMRRFVTDTWSGHGVVLGAGIHTAELDRDDISGDRFRARHGLEGVAIVLQVSRKTPSKGYAMAAEAVAAIDGTRRPVRFVLIGPDEDGAAIVTPSTLYLGRVERTELLDALDACDTFVLPSLNESFGLAYLEAWMRRKPVIGHGRCDAARDLIEPGIDGELVSDVDELAATLGRLLANPGEAARLGESGRAKVLSAYTWDRVVERAYQTLCEVTGRGA